MTHRGSSKRRSFPLSLWERVGVRALLVLAVGLLGLPSQPAAADDGFRVLSESQTIQFQRNIQFTIELEAPADVKSILFRYRIGSRPITNVGYPTFDAGSKVKAEFSLPSGGASYMPPGTDIRYSYLVEDARGQTFETEPRTFLYQDTRFKWETLSKGLITVHYHNLFPITAERVADTLTSTNQRMGDVLGVRVDSPTKAVLYNTVEEMNGALPPQSETLRRQLVTEGQAYAEYDLVLLLGSRPDTVAHEFTHLLVHKAADNAFAPIPGWLNEGLAVYAQSEAREYEQALSQAIRRDRLLLLRGMAGRPGGAEETILFYGQSFSTVRYLIKTYGEEKMRAFLTAFKEGIGIEPAMRKVYGLGLGQLEADWRQSVGAKPLPIGSQDEPERAAPEAVPTLVPFGSAPQPPAAGPTAQPAGREPPGAAPPEEGRGVPWLLILLPAVLAVVVVGGLVAVIAVALARRET